LRATEDAIARRLGLRSQDSDAMRLAGAGVARLLLLLKSAEVAHPRLKARHPQQSALITLADRLVAGATALELLSRTAPGPDERARLQRVAERCARARRTLLGDGMFEHVGPADRPPLGADGSAVFPVLVELEHVVDSMEQALGPEGISREFVGSEPKHLFVLDAFTNPSYVRYALKGALAVMICYTLQSAVDWPGIRTCLITCLIVGLGSEGATVQKGTLRIAGALVGAAMGFLAILVVVPRMESITSLALLVAAIIARDPPDFSDVSIVAVVRDGERHPVWAIRLARAAHQIAADTLRDEPAPPGRVYQLWLLVADRSAPRQLGLLPPSGRKRIAVSPENARLLAGTGELVVTLEPAGGSPNREPSGQPVFRGTVERAG